MKASCYDSKSGLAKKSSETADVNSYKFARPRLYIPNEYPITELTHLDKLVQLSTHIGPKLRTPEYNDKLVRLLMVSKPKRISKKKRSPIVQLNSAKTAHSNIRLTQFGLDELKL